MKNIILPLTKDIIKTLKVGDEVLLTGTIYTARDVAHKRICEAIRNRKSPPIKLRDNIIYYCGPAPAMPGRTIGSCGPTTAKRMDRFVSLLLSRGLSGMIGKGEVSQETEDALKRYKGVYLTAIGGAGAYLANKVKRASVVAYKDLGPEAIYELKIENFPVIVAIDSKGRNIYKLLEQGAA